jgi:hypothetical protein
VTFRAPGEPASPPQLDPFAFPPETHGRFRMLMLAAVLVCANLGFTFSSWTQDHQWIADLGRRMSLLRRDAPDNPAKIDPARMRRTSEDNFRLIRDTSGPILAFTLPPAAMVALLCAGALLLYRLHPRRVRRRHRTKALTAEDAPRVTAELRLWADRCGISPPPSLEWCPGMAQGMAFGRRRSEVLLLHGSPATIEGAWSTGNTSRVIALHEFGHIANGDAQDREGARAIWSMLLALMLLFAVFFLPGRGALGWMIGCQCAALLTMIWTTWAGLLRVREIYADWRVASWGMGTALMGLLRLEQAAGRGVGARRRAWPWERHPPLHLRADALRDPSILFHVSADLSLLTGVLLGVVAASLPTSATVLISACALPFALLHLAVMPHIAALPPALKAPLAYASAFTLNLGAPLLMTTLVLFGLSFLVTNTLGVQVQREAISDLACGRHSRWRYLPLWRTAVIVALGTELGFSMVPMSMFFPLIPTWPAVPLWFAGFTCLVWLWLGYVRAAARMVLGTRAGRTNPRQLSRLVSLASAAALTILFWPAAAARLTLLFTNPGVMNSVFAGYNSRNVFMIGFFFTTFVLFALAVGLFVLFAAFSLVVASLALACGRSLCPTCSQPIRRRLIVGRSCPGCGEPLALWAFLVGGSTARAARPCATR